MTVPHIQMMTRRQCCLCDDASKVLEAAAASGLCSWEAVNVDLDKGLLVRYGMDVPVLLCQGKQLFKHRVSAEQLQLALSELTTTGEGA